LLKKSLLKYKSISVHYSDKSNQNLISYRGAAMENFIRFILVTILSVTLIGCATNLDQIQADFATAEKANTVAAYQEFIEKYPKPNRAEQYWCDGAFVRMRELEFRAEEEHGNLASLRAFISKYQIFLAPGDKYVI